MNPTTRDPTFYRKAPSRQTMARRHGLTVVNGFPLLLIPESIPLRCWNQQSGGRCWIWRRVLLKTTMAVKRILYLRPCLAQLKLVEKLAYQ
jgi:hypothetical protein